MKIGLNTQRLAFGSDGAFVNLMKHANSGSPNYSTAPWTPILWPARAMDTRPLAVDRYGTVQSLLSGQAAMTNVPVLMGGSYVLTYAGKGTIVLGPQATITDSQPGMISFSLPNPQPLQLYQLQVVITATDPTDPITAIVIEPTNLNSLGEFYLNFLNAIAPVCSLLRLHEWARIDEVSAAEWADRTPPNHQTMAGTLYGGVAYEKQIDLANTEQKNLWINVPHTATDDHVTQLATLLRDTLDSNLQIYLEYSNECWNGQYPQHQYCVTQGRALALDTNPGAAALKFQALRSAQIFKIFASVFGSDSGRVVKVISSQIGATWAHQVLLTELVSQGIEPDALAVAAYFGYPQIDSTLAAQIISGGVDWVASDLLTTKVPQTLSGLQISMNVAKANNIQLVCYESGPDLVERNPTLPTSEVSQINAVFDQVNDDPRMAGIFQALYDGAKSIGVSLLNHYAAIYRPGQYGRWGLLHVRDQDPKTSPKYQAVLNWIGANP